MVEKSVIAFLFYNILMIMAICIFFPIWVPLVMHRKKHRHTFWKRFFMKAISKKTVITATKKKRGRIWIHALSVGEVLSAEPLVKILAEKVGAGQLVFTASTQSGYETALRVAAPYVSEVRYFPYDLFFSVNRALKVIAPRKVVIVETDIWPNFLYRLKRYNIPVYLVNARLSKRSYTGYKRVGFLMAPLLSIFTKICVQTLRDRERFEDLGVCKEQIVTVGNIKFDQEPVNVSEEKLQLISKQLFLSENLPVLVAGSTHEGEEEILSDAYRKMCQEGIESILIVAPRDPERAAVVCKLFNHQGTDAVTLDELEIKQMAFNVVIIDRIGILRWLYALADVAFVGGSLVRAGGHNPLEPASVRKPVLFGPHTEDFEWICQTLVKAGGAVRVSDSDQLANQIMRLISNREQNQLMGRSAHEVFASHQGAVKRTLDIIFSF